MRTDEVLGLLQRVAEQVINPRFRALRSDQILEKNPGDLVTVADREAEERITEALQRAYPQAVILGEEAVASDPGLLRRFRAAEHAFTIDPVDGTKNFVHGSPDHAVMAAEVRDGVVRRSWIWQPQHRLAYVAKRGGGAWCDGVRLTRPAPGVPPRGVTSRRTWVGTRLAGLPPLELTWVCCGVDYPKLVAGASDFSLYRNPKPWDHAPGTLLLTEAGGFAGTVDAGPYRPQEDAPQRLLAAADRATYDTVRAALLAL